MGSVRSWISWKLGRVLIRMEVEAEDRGRNWKWMETKNRNPAEGLTSKRSWEQGWNHTWNGLRIHPRAQESCKGCREGAGRVVAASIGGGSNIPDVLGAPGGKGSSLALLVLSVARQCPNLRSLVSIMG